MKKIKLIFLAFILAILVLPIASYANQDEINIIINEEILINGNAISSDESQEVYLSNIENNIKVINIANEGKYVISGSAEDVQIVIKSERIKTDIEIVLDNITLTNENVPVIYTEPSDKNIVINIKEGTENFMSSIKSESYLTIDGNGNLKIGSKDLIGIETAKDLNIKNGNILINSTKNAIKAGNDVNIENGFLVANVDKEAEGVSTILATGKIKINSGKVYSIASENECKSFEAENGTFINGGTVVGVGTLNSDLQTENNTIYMEMHTNTPIREKESAVVADTDKNPLFAYKMDRMCKVFIYTSPDVQKTPFMLYGGSDIKGTVDEYNVYSKIDNVNFDNLVKHEDRETPYNPGNMNIRKYTMEQVIMINRGVKIGIIVIGGVIFIIMAVANVKNKKINGFVNLFVGILIGVLIGFGVSQLIIGESIEVTRTDYERATQEQLPEMPDMQGDVTPPEFQQGSGTQQRPNGFDPSSNR